MGCMENTKFGKQAPCKDFMLFGSAPEASNFRSCTGYWFDRITSALTGETVEFGREFNMIVSSIGRLAAVRFRGDANYHGLQVWAVGSGLADWDGRWDGGMPPSPDPTATRLVNEIGRLPLSIAGGDSSIAYADRDGNPSEGITNRLLVRRTFGRGDANGDWREFALFGGDASEARGSGIMVNHKLHRVISKTSDMTVERSIIFTFN